MTIEFQTRAIPGQQNRGAGFLICDGTEDRPVLIYNSDSGGHVFNVGGDMSVDIVRQVNSIPMAPGTVLVIDGNVPTYIASPTGPGQISHVSIYPGAIEYDVAQ